MSRQLTQWVWLTAIGVLCGYGERPERTIAWILTTFVGLGLVYSLGAGLRDASCADCWYYSAVSMVALGYGGWVPEPHWWARALGAFQSFIGVFLMALFLVTFTRKMTR